MDEDDTKLIAQMLKNESIVDGTAVFIGDNDITKEEVMKDVSKRFMYMQQMFFRAAKMKSKMNDNVVQLYFHAIIGAYLKEYTIIKGGGITDLRIPIIWIQNSSSGKSQLNNVGIDVARRIGLKAVDNTEFTTPGMIGTFDKAKHDHNIKNNLHPGDDIMSTDKNGNQKRRSYQVPITYGDVYYNDIIFVDEAKVLFQPSRHTENILSVLQPALDYPGHIRKKLSAEEPIEYDCNCTIVSSTIEWGKVGVDVMAQGYFPRCLFFAKSLSVGDYMDMHSNLGVRILNEEAYSSFLNDFAEVIEKHKFPLNRDKKKITVLHECLDIINATVQSWFRLIAEKLYGPELQVAKPIVSRMHAFIFKIAGQVAVLNNNINPKVTTETIYLVTPDEVQYAIDLLNGLFSRMVDTLAIDENQEDKQIYSTGISIMKKMVGMGVNDLPKQDVVRIIMTTRNMGKQRASRLYTALCSANLLTEKIAPRSTAIHTVPNWKLWIDKDVRVAKELNLDDGGKKDDKTNMQKAPDTSDWDQMP